MMVDIYTRDIITASNNVLNKTKLYGKRFLITGASGLVGRAVIKMLSVCNKNDNANIKIVACGRSADELKLIFSPLDDENISYCETDYSKQMKPDGVFDGIIHLAAITSSQMFASDPAKVIFDNIKMLQMVFNFASTQKKSRLVYVSSQEVYGEPYKRQKTLKEDEFGFLSINDTRSIYPYTKRIGELLCTTYKKQYGLDFVVLRFAKLFGADFHESDKRIGADFLLRAAKGEIITLNTKGTQKVSFCYILDAVAALLSVFTTAQSGEIYNAAECGRAVTPFEFANICAKYGNTEVTVKETKTDLGYSKVSHMVLDYNKIKELGFNSLYNIETAIKRSIEILKRGHFYL